MKKNPCSILVFGLVLLIFQQTSFAQEWQYEVKRGDSLWSISDQYLIHFSYVRRLQKYNNVVNPLLLQPGRIIKAPVTWLGNLPGSATVQSVNGAVEIISANQKGKVATGYELKANDKLVTGDDGSMQIEFSDKSILKVYSNTSLAFKSIKQSHDGSVINAIIEIEQGRVNVQVNPGKKPGHRLEIESPSAVTAVRGTEFRIGVNPQSGDTVTEVLKGRVSVSAANRAISVKEFFGTKTEQGSKPMRPIRLLGAPDIAVPQSVIETRVASLTWSELEGAEAYRVRVSSTEDFSDVFYDEMVQTAKIENMFFTRDGEFFASVRAINKDHIEGIDSVVSLKVNARPEPPLAISPKAITFDPLPEFSWTLPGNGTEKTQFQLSKEKDFGNVLIDKTFDPGDNLVLEEPLPEGQYYWRVANIDREGQGPYSKPFIFAIKLLPEITTEIIESESGSQIRLSLSKDPSVSRYHVQVARDAGFENIIFDDWVSQEEFVFDTRGAGSYYIRLGVEDQASNTINYADAQKFIVPFDEWKKVLISIAAGLLILL